MSVWAGSPGVDRRVTRPVPAERPRQVRGRRRAGRPIERRSASARACSTDGGQDEQAGTGLLADGRGRQTPPDRHGRCSPPELPNSGRYRRLRRSPARTAATRRLRSSLRLSPAVDEMRQVVPTSDMRGLRGAGPARCWMAGGYWHQQKPPGSSVSRCEPLNALLPAERQRRPTGDGSWGGQEHEDRRATCLTVRSAVMRQQASGPWWRPWRLRPAARTSREPG